MSEAPIRVVIVDRTHPHYGERGVLTGKIIHFTHWAGEMAEVRLDACRHGTEGCFVEKGQVARDSMPEMS